MSMRFYFIFLDRRQEGHPRKRDPEARSTPTGALRDEPLDVVSGAAALGRGAANARQPAHVLDHAARRGSELATGGALKACDAFRGTGRGGG